MVCTALTPQKNVYTTLTSLIKNCLHKFDSIKYMSDSTNKLIAQFSLNKNMSAQVWLNTQTTSLSAQTCLHKKHMYLHSFDSTKKLSAKLWLHIKYCCLNSFDSIPKMFLVCTTVNPQEAFYLHSFDATTKKWWLHSFDSTNAFLFCTNLTPQTSFVCSSLPPQNNIVCLHKFDSTKKWCLHSFGSTKHTCLRCSDSTTSCCLRSLDYTKNRSAQLWLHKKAGLHSFDTTKEMPAQCWLHILLSALFWLQANCCMHSLDSTNNVFLPGSNSIRNVLSAQLLIPRKKIACTVLTSQANSCLHNFDITKNACTVWLHNTQVLSAQLWLHIFPAQLWRHEQTCLHNFDSTNKKSAQLWLQENDCTILIPHILSAQLRLHENMFVCTVLTPHCLVYTVFDILKCSCLHSFDSPKNLPAQFWFYKRKRRSSWERLELTEGNWVLLEGPCGVKFKMNDFSCFWMDLMSFLKPAWGSSWDPLELTEGNMKTLWRVHLGTNQDEWLILIFDGSYVSSGANLGQLEAYLGSSWGPLELTEGNVRALWRVHL